MKKGPPPCIKCDNKGCGAYHDICPDYQAWINDEVEDDSTYREYVSESMWRNSYKISRNQKRNLKQKSKM